MVNQVGGNLLQSAFTTDNGFLACPFRKAFLSLGQFVSFGDFFNPFIQNFPVIFREFDLRKTAFVINAYRCAVFYRLLNVIDINIITENRLRVFIFLFNRSAGKTDK